MADAADLVHCSLCRFPRRTISEWISHLRLVHSKDDDFLLRLGLTDAQMNIENAHRLFLMFIGVIGIWSLHVRKKVIVLLLRKEFLVIIALLLSH